jgi:hypothetical protein
LSYLTDIAPLVQYENYPGVRQSIVKMGISPNIVPDPSYFEQLGQQNGVPGKQIFDIWKNNAMTGLQRQALRIKMANEGWKPQSKAEAIEVAQAKQKPEARSNIAKMIEERDSLPQGDPNRAIFDAAITKATQTKDQNLSVTMDKDGNIQITSGTGTAGTSTSGMPKPTETKVANKLFDAENSQARLLDIESKYKQAVANNPNLLTWKSKAAQKLISWKSSAGKEISPEDRKSREEFVSLQRAAISNLSTYLNEISGAAVTQQEYERLTKVMPSVGTGITDGDDPIEFERKLKDVIEETKLAISRYKYILSTGLTDEKTLIANMKKNQVPYSIGVFRTMIEGRGKEIAEELKKAGTDEREIRGIVKERLRQEFKL